MVFTTTPTTPSKPSFLESSPKRKSPHPYQNRISNPPLGPLSKVLAHPIRDGRAQPADYQLQRCAPLNKIGGHPRPSWHLIIFFAFAIAFLSGFINHLPRTYPVKLNPSIQWLASFFFPGLGLPHPRRSLEGKQYTIQKRVVIRGSESRNTCYY